MTFYRYIYFLCRSINRSRKNPTYNMLFFCTLALAAFVSIIIDKSVDTVKYKLNKKLSANHLSPIQFEKW